MLMFTTIYIYIYIYVFIHIATLASIICFYLQFRIDGVNDVLWTFLASALN